MLKFAKNEFEMETVQKDGHSLRDHLTALQRRSKGRRIERLHMRVPPLLEHVWETFIALRVAAIPRKPITFSDINSYMVLMSIRLDAREVGVIRQLDVAYLASLSGNDLRPEEDD